MHARPVQPVDQRRGLRRRPLHHPVSRAWPTELSIVQALRHQHQPGSVPDQELYPVRPARPEDKQHARERIESELALDQRGEAHHSFPEVYGLRRNQHLQGARRADNALTCTARSEEHTSELKSLMRTSSAVICLKKKNIKTPHNYTTPTQHTTPKIYQRN